jgi:hypothetical protein
VHSTSATSEVLAEHLGIRQPLGFGQITGIDRRFA